MFGEKTLKMIQIFWSDSKKEFGKATLPKSGYSNYQFFMKLRSISTIRVQFSLNFAPDSEFVVLKITCKEQQVNHKRLLVNFVVILSVVISPSTS